MHKLFEEAERLQPPAGMWQRIAAETRLAARARGGAWSRLENPYLRAAAVVAFAALVAGLALWGAGRLGHGSEGNVKGTLAAGGSAAGGMRSVAAASEAMTVATPGDSTLAEIFDSELLGWQADLGEVDLEADAAEEVL